MEKHGIGRKIRVNLTAPRLTSNDFMKYIIKKLFIDCSSLQGYVAHTPHGAFTVFAAVYIHWTIALLFGFGFIVFEIVQQGNEGDKAHQDLAGWLAGMFIGGLAYCIFLR